MNAELQQYLLEGESEYIKFKESFNDEAIETLGAFMNANGGVVLVGVKDCGTVCGYPIGKTTPEDM